MDPASGLNQLKNVGISQGKIASISDSQIEGQQIISAPGQILCPGFIDLHCHPQDPQIFEVQALDGVTTTHHGIDLNSKPTVTMQTQGAATNLIESYHGPGLKSFTRINRDIITESVTETMSTFTQ